MAEPVDGERSGDGSSHGAVVVAEATFGDLVAGAVDARSLHAALGVGADFRT